MFLHLSSLDSIVSEEDNSTSLIDLIEYGLNVGIGAMSENFLNPEELFMKGELKILVQQCLHELNACRN